MAFQKQSKFKAGKKVDEDLEDEPPVFKEAYLKEKFMDEKLKELKDILNIQLMNGNWNYDPYMHGMLNGMILMIAILEDEPPIFKEAPPFWLCEKTPTEELLKQTGFWIEDGVAKTD